MDPVWALAGSIGIAAVLWFFKTPKESASELAARVLAIETAQNALNARFAGMDGKLGAQISALSDNIKELASNVRELTRRMDAHRVGP
jgi:hypothetical protein